MNTNHTENIKFINKTLNHSIDELNERIFYLRSYGMNKNIHITNQVGRIKQIIDDLETVRKLIIP